MTDQHRTTIAAQTFSALCRMGARPTWTVSPATSCRLSATDFDTGVQHGPHLPVPDYAREEFFRALRRKHGIKHAGGKRWIAPKR